MTPSSPTLAEAAASPSRVVLIGMMGAGKSHVGRLVASRLGWPYLDSDQQVEHTSGIPVARIFAEQGEAAFRALEARALAEALAGPGPLVLAVAGGAVLAADNRRLLHRAGLIVWLRAELPTLAQRVGGADHRPLLAGDHLLRLTRLYAERRPRYQELAQVIIDVDDLTPDEAADQVVAARHAHWAQRPLGAGAGTAGRAEGPWPVGGGRGA